jgi:hypothetical protein
MTPWEIQADEFASCNCDYGCPCQFNALPTHGTCEAMAGFQIHRGHFGDVSLDGLRMVGVLAWPGPIHEGRGKSMWIIDERADEAQRAALLTIVNGGETDPGATMWNVFASTMETTFDPVFKPIELEIDVDGRVGRVFVQNLVESSGTPIRNPVTGDEHRARIDLPHGFEYRLAEVGSGTFKTSGPISMSHKDSYGQFARIHLSNHGVVEKAA